MYAILEKEMGDEYSVVIESEELSKEEKKAELKKINEKYVRMHKWFKRKDKGQSVPLSFEKTKIEKEKNNAT